MLILASEKWIFIVNYDVMQFILLFLDVLKNKDMAYKFTMPIV